MDKHKQQAILNAYHLTTLLNKGWAIMVMGNDQYIVYKGEPINKHNLGRIEIKARHYPNGAIQFYTCHIHGSNEVIETDKDPNKSLQKALTEFKKRATVDSNEVAEVERIINGSFSP